jgi:hypothetical protein
VAINGGPTTEMTIEGHLSAAEVAIWQLGRMLFNTIRPITAISLLLSKRPSASICLGLREGGFDVQILTTFSSSVMVFGDSH